MPTERKTDVWTSIDAQEAAVFLELEVIADAQVEADALTLTLDNGQRVRISVVHSASLDEQGRIGSLQYERAR